jgi:hypothetical protein
MPIQNGSNRSPEPKGAAGLQDQEAPRLIRAAGRVSSLLVRTSAHASSGGQRPDHQVGEGERGDTFPPQGPGRMISVSER